MKNRKVFLYSILLLAGVALIAAALFLRLAELPKPVGGFLIGLGGMSVGLSLSKLLTLRIIAKNPDVGRQMKIEEKDERNIALRNRAKAMGFDAMGVIFGLIMMIYILLNADLSIILILVGGYLLVYFIQMYFLAKYSKEM